MEQKQLKGFSKFIALLVISALVISVIIFTANGNEFGIDQPTANDTPQDIPMKDDNAVNTPTDDGSDTGGDEEQTPVQTPPEAVFKNVLTGLEITESEYNSCAYGIVIDPSEAIYGLSYADIAIEFPTEMGDSRMLFFSSTDEVIWKIGALMPTRKYITAMSGFFGGIIVANGEDDKNNYTQDDVGKLLDLSKHTDCAYNENGKLYYTNEKLIEIALNRTQYIATDNKYTTPPFIFGESTFIDGINCADQVVIPYKDDNSTRLIYDKSIDKYIYIKNSASKTDMLNGETIAFTNAFILFADSATYESSTDTELVIDTQSGGSGYYFHGGKMTEIRWKSSNGKLLFTNLMGEVLSVDPGNSYMSFFKSSEYSNITMS